MKHKILRLLQWLGIFTTVTIHISYNRDDVTGENGDCKLWVGVTGTPSIDTRMDDYFKANPLGTFVVVDSVYKSAFGDDNVLYEVNGKKASYYDVLGVLG